MKKIMISQPMNGKTDKEIIEVRNATAKKLEKMGYSVVNTFFDDKMYSPEMLRNRGGVKDSGVYLLGLSLEEMSRCDAVCFVDGWENARGCKIEHEVAKAYGLSCLYGVVEK